jgi:4-amino-4-deoxy-L-arabinose transferase-like glycosyltransferase
MRRPAEMNANTKSRPWLVALLVAMCLVPRAVAAWNLDVLWGDSLHYRYASICLERGEFEQAFAEFGLNIYPLILIPLRHLGLDWQITGKAFGAIIASLTVVPLWGWLRRMFDDRTAAIACCAYALHGKLIANSPFILRDPTFWFLFVLTLYCLWRAIGELRIGLFLAAGMALTLAVHTRTEGWLLLIPLTGWAAWRWSSAKGKRLRLIAGTLLSVAVIPASVAAVNFTWLREHPHWEFFRPVHYVMAVDWWNSVTGMDLRVPCPEIVSPAQSNVPQSAADHEYMVPAVGGNAVPEKGPAPFTGAHTAPPTMSTRCPSSILVPLSLPPEATTPGWKLTLKFLERFVKSYTWVGGALLLIGLACGWRVFLRAEHLTLLALSFSILVVTRIRYGIAGIDQRYFMPIVILGVPWMALGLDYVLAAARRLVERREEASPRAGRILAGGLIAAAVLCSFVDGPISTPAYMHKHRDLGLWINRHVGPEQSIVGNFDEMNLDVFYANGHVVSIVWPRACLLAPMPAALTERWGDVVVLWNDDNNIGKEYWPIVAQRIAGYCGYRRVDPKDLPVSEDEVMVFLREPEPPPVAAREQR